MPIAPHIHLLDDDPSVLKSLGRLLAAEGYAVGSFSTVGEFIQVATTHPAALAILDFSMPGLSGLQVQQCLSSFAPDTRVIMISATHEPSVREQALQAGACAYLPKPFDDQTFLDAVRHALTSVPC